LTNPLSRLADRLGVPDPHQAEDDMPDTPAAYRPTPRQLALLRRLAHERGVTFPWPSTRAQASRAIDRLLARTPDSRLERALDRRAIQHQLAECPLDAAAVRPSEIEGYGSTATWKGSR
jgi:hypothetical protein